MVLAGVQLRSVAVVPRNDSAQPLFSLNLALVGRLEILAKNPVTNIHSLMRSLIIIVCKPLPVDIVELLKAYAKEVIQTLPFCLSDITLDERIRHRSAHGRLNYFRSRTFPELVKPSRIFRIAVTMQDTALQVFILHMHLKIPGLLRRPLSCGIRRAR